MADAIKKFQEVLKDVDELSSLDSDSDEENGQETLKVPESSK